MKRVIWIIPAILFLCVTSQAQETTPAWEIYGGYSYLKGNLNGSGPSFHMNGGGASVDQNFNNWFGGRFAVNAFGGTFEGTNVTAQTFTYGPVFAYRKFDRFVPYAHVQFGDVHASRGYLGISESANKFAMVSGGGVDVKINQLAAIRLQADYLMTRFLSQRQDNLQFSTGLVIRFGHK
jgi:hypothetical protein